MTYIFTIIGLGIAYMLYKRYAPVSVPCVKEQDQEKQSMVVVDLRDYNMADKKPSRNAIHIPIAYIDRHYQEIPSKEVHVIAQNQVEKNMGVRLLRKRGFNVMSYTMSNCSCK